MFELRVSTGVDPLTGRKRGRSRRFRGSRIEAEAALAELVADENATRPRVDKHNAATTVTLADVVHLYLSDASLAPGTLKAYRSVMSRHIGPALGDTLIGRIDRSVLERFYEQLGRTGLSASTVRSVHVVIRQALREAVQRGWLGANPAADLNLPVIQPGPAARPTAAQLAQVMEGVGESDPEFAVFLGLTIATRARRGELCALRWTAVDLDRGIVHIRSNVVVADGGLQLQELNPRTRRSVPIDDATVAVLRDHHRRNSDERPRDTFVFSSHADGMTPWRPELPSKRWAALRQLVGLDHLRLQDLHLVADSPQAVDIPPGDTLAEQVSGTPSSYQRLTDDEFGQLVRLLRRYVETDIDRFSHWSISTTFGSAFVGVTLHVPDPERWVSLDRWLAEP